MGNKWNGRHKDNVAKRGRTKTQRKKKKKKRKKKDS